MKPKTKQAKSPKPPKKKSARKKKSQKAKPAKATPKKKASARKTSGNRRALSQARDFLDRDHSWLEFNARVLNEALDPRTPLLERLRFLGIFTNNLDEFVMKRVGLLRLQLAGRSGPRAESDALRHLSRLKATIMPLLTAQSDCYEKELRPALAAEGIQLLEWDALTKAEQKEANAYFERDVFPVLTPQSVDLGHPFPFLSNLSLSLAVELFSPSADEKLFARIKVPRLLPQWIQVSADTDATLRLVSLEQLTFHNLGKLFRGMEIVDVMAVRVTRNAVVPEESDQPADLLALVEQQVRQRRLLEVIRLEHSKNPNPWLRDRVMDELGLVPEQVYEMPGLLDHTRFAEVVDLPLPELKYRPWTPTVPSSLASEGADLFGQIRASDLLVHHPYESFDGTVARFIRAAVEDDDVLGIKMTVYRTSDDSPFVPLLIRAAELGKQVVCLVELKARFDEDRNIRWANALETAGVHVVYGVLGLKTHCKTALVVRREGEGLRCYAHIGTGNYNPQTARLYEDLGLFTCNAELAAEVVELFHYLTGRSLKQDYQKLLVAPVNMKQRFLDLIAREAKHARAGKPSGIVAKMNQLEDRDICRALERASRAGVQIDLIVRGLCVLRPGVDGKTDNIRVTSVIGRFLEHSRIYHFRNGADEAEGGLFYIGSADWMHRNLEERVEAITPIEDRPLRGRCWEILKLILDDERQAWEMQPDGSYVQRQPKGGDAPGTHALLMERTRARNELYRPTHAG